MSERFEVDCEGARHTLELDGDVVRALDHDAEAEEVLGAMGGRTPFCLRAADAWTHFEPSPDDARQLIAVADQTLLSESGRAAIERQADFAERRFEVLAKRRTLNQHEWAQFRRRNLLGARLSVMLRLPDELRRRWLDRYLRDAEPAFAALPEERDPSPVELLLFAACERTLASSVRREEKKVWWKGLRADESPGLFEAPPSQPGVTIVGVPISWLRTTWLRGRAIAPDESMVVSAADAPSVLLTFDRHGAPVLRAAQNSA